MNMDKFGKIFLKMFLKNLKFSIKKFKKIFVHNVHSKIVSLLKFWWEGRFEWLTRQNLTKIQFAIFWIEYTINEKNIWCHVVSGSRSTIFSLVQLNPWLPNLLYRPPRPTQNKGSILDTRQSYVLRRSWFSVIVDYYHERLRAYDYLVSNIEPFSWN